MLRYLTSILMLSLIPAFVLADEAWETRLGPVTYHTEIDGMAVFRMRLDDVWGLIYLPGLAGNYTDRGTHKGFWVSDEIGPCAAKLQSPEGLTTSSWGRVEITFDAPAFPTGWTMMLGACFNDPDIKLRGEL